MRKERKSPNTSQQNKTNTETKRTTLPYINKISEITRLLKPHGKEVAHKPAHKLHNLFTQHKDTTDILEKNNAIYMFPCRDCDKLYIRETSKKINTRPTEHKNAIGRHDSRSLPGTHADDSGQINSTG